MARPVLMCLFELERQSRQFIISLPAIGFPMLVSSGPAAAFPL
jgi:hypothetical protein